MDQFAARKRMRGQGGFTLIELLVVIAILAVLGGAVVIGIGSLRGNAQEQACKTDRETIATAAEAYKTSNDVYPTVAQLKAANLIKIKTGKNDAEQNFSIDATSGAVTALSTKPGGGDAKYKAVAIACNTD